MVFALGRLIQERDNTDAVTARYHWGFGELLNRGAGSF